jgi:hypothetical protein
MSSSQASFVRLAILLIAACGVARAALNETPLNHAALVGDTVVLRCSANDIPPATRITWTEFTTTPGGIIITDNYNVSVSHPNRERYQILTDITRTQFYLQITNVQLNDGGKYLCSDLQAIGPVTIRGYAELVVLETDPVCIDFTSITGNVVEGWSYSSECLTTFKGNIAPVMTFTGPLPFSINASTTDTTVWSWIRFTAASHMEGQAYECNTKFEELTDVEDTQASNAPDYTHHHPGTPLSVVWPPRETAIQPIQMYYNIGDILKCSTNSKPVATFRWGIYRTLEDFDGETLEVTPDFEGLTTLVRCDARVIIEGSETIDFVHINVTVPSVTTPTVATTTPVPTTPPAISECDDPTGQWTAYNPDALACLEMDNRGNLLTLIRNGSDLFFLAGNGKTVVGDYKHIGFTGMWPDGQGTAGFVGECHKCMGVEVILLSGLKRNKYSSDECGQSAGTNLSRLYVMTRSGAPCRGMELDIANPNPIMLAKMGIKAKNYPQK